MVGIKKALSLYSERMTVALRGGIPPFVNRWQRYDKIPKPARDSGKKCEKSAEKSEFVYHFACR